MFGGKKEQSAAMMRYRLNRGNKKNTNGRRWEFSTPTFPGIFFLTSSRLLYVPPTEVSPILYNRFSLLKKGDAILLCTGKRKIRNTSANNKIHRKWMTAIIFIGSILYFGDVLLLAYCTCSRTSVEEKQIVFPCVFLSAQSIGIQKLYIESVRTFFVCFLIFLDWRFTNWKQCTNIARMVLAIK